MILFSSSGIMDDNLRIDKPLEVDPRSVLVVIGDREKEQFRISCLKNYAFISHSYSHVTPSKGIDVRKIKEWLYISSNI